MAIFRFSPAESQVLFSYLSSPGDREVLFRARPDRTQVIAEVPLPPKIISTFTEQNESLLHKTLQNSFCILHT